jgi:branched-chain amino acid transport system ATP-binding protein
MSLLEVRGLTKDFGVLRALDDVDVVVRPGEILGMIGPNGSGKTTLFNCVMGLLAPTGGEVCLAGERIDGLPAHEVVERGVARTFQLARVFPELTVLQNMLVGQPHQGEGVWTALLRAAAREAVERAEGLLDLVGLRAERDQLACELSYGQQKLLEFAMALMKGARLLLLDEPTAGVNPTLTRRLLDRIRQLNEGGISFFIIEHNMNVIMEISHRICVLASGGKIADGPPAEVRRDERVYQAYFGA